MAHAAATNLAPASEGKSVVGKALTIIVWTAIVGIAIAFVLKYVFHYYLNYNTTAFDPHWTRRAWLLLHITGGMIALLTAPWQLFTGLTGKRMNVHRYTGRAFVGGVTVGVIGATYLAFTRRLDGRSDSESLDWRGPGPRRLRWPTMPFASAKSKSTRSG